MNKKGGVGTLFIIVLILIFIGLFLALGSNNGAKVTVTTAIVANASFNTTLNNTINTTIIYNTTLNVPNLPANNVSSGTFNGSYTFKNTPGGDTRNILTIGTTGFHVWDDTSGAEIFTVLRNNPNEEIDLNANTIAFFDFPAGTNYMNLDTVNKVFTVYSWNVTNGLGVKGATTLTTLWATATNVTTIGTSGIASIGSNLTFAAANQCETHKGTQANYTRCFNSTGQVTETFGVFPA